MNTRWVIKPADPTSARSLAHELDIHPALAQTFINRGFSAPADIRRFLSPNLADLANPFDLPDLEAAAEHLAEAVIQKKRIGLFADYDADGVTSAAVFVAFFRDIGQEVVWYVPDRLSQGYGLNRPGLEFMARQGVALLVSADCGTTDLEQLALAERLGLQAIVTDHHQLGPQQPQSLAFVNPQRPDAPEAFKDLAGVGVVFFLLMGLRAVLRQRGFFRRVPEPNLKNLLDLVALGTLADVAPVIGQNRILLSAGLEVLAGARRPGLSALSRVARVDGKLGSREIIFGLAPRVNAPGRLGRPDLGLRLLIAQDVEQTQALAQEVNQLNSRRQRIERQVLDQALTQLESQGDPSKRLALVAADEEWHQGVLGIVAARLSRLFHRPAFVFRIEGDTAVGSGRSIEAFHLHRGLKNLSELLIQFGGHSQAAGLRIKTERLDRFAAALESEVGRCVDAPDLKPSLSVDASLDLDDLNGKLLDDLERMTPFGPGNPEPVFWAERVGLISKRAVGQGRSHLFLTLRQDRSTWPAIAFNKGPLIFDLPPVAKIAYHPVRESFRGQERIKLQVTSIRIN